MYPRDRPGRQDKFHEQAGQDMMDIGQDSPVQGYLYLDAVETSDRKHIAKLLARAYAGETSHFEFKSSGHAEKFSSHALCPSKSPTAVLKN